MFKVSTLFRNTLILLIMFFLASCSSTNNTVSENTNESDTQTEERDDSRLEELYWARQDSARMDFTEADVNFMIGMISHHAQALIMSRMAPTHGASPEVQTLAARIINSQKDEIKSMQQWLRDRDQPVPEVHIEGLNLMLHGLGDHHADMDHTSMPGMLSQEQLHGLDAARGSRFDRLFLTYMIDHHLGAVTMVENLFDTNGAAQDEAAFKLASDIQVDQRTEIARMRLMLEEIPGATQKP